MISTGTQTLRDSASQGNIPPILYRNHDKDMGDAYRKVYGSIQVVHMASNFLVFLFIVQAPLRGGRFSAQWLLWPLFTSVMSTVVYFIHGRHRPRHTSTACRKCNITCYTEQSILSASGAILLAIRASTNDGLCQDLARTDDDCVNAYIALAASWISFVSVLNGLGLSMLNIFPPPEPQLKFQAADLRFRRTWNSEVSPTIVGDDWAPSKYRLHV